MEIEISSNTNQTVETSRALKELGNIIEKNCDVCINKIYTDNIDGFKDSGLVIALTATGIALTAISTLISSIEYWERKQEDKKEKYAISLSIENKVYHINNMDSSSFISILEDDLKKIQEKPEKINIIFKKVTNG